jgi:aryl-alcohol dehydrogenase-like predicted oxidoreductase
MEGLGDRLRHVGHGQLERSDDEESLRALGAAIARGCTFFDTAWAYGAGRSERLLGDARRRYPHAPMHLATKVPPKYMKWPASAASTLAETYPSDHVRQYTEQSLRDLGVETIDLQQFHVWTDEWAADESWQRTVADLKDAGLIRAFGISVTAGSRPTSCAPSSRASSTACRLSTTSSTSQRRTSFCRTARRTALPSSRVCRSTKAA